MKIGIDLGGSHIGVGLIDEKGKIIIEKEKDLLKEDKQNIKEIIINTIKDYILYILKEQNISINEIKCIGIAFPAALKNGKVGLAVNLGINGNEIQSCIQEYFKIPVYIRNDAKCAALCEKEFGSLKSYENAIFITIGTGIGGAVFTNGKLLTIEDNDTFEIGHMIIEKDGIKCSCGRSGCFETYASIRALKDRITYEYSIKKEITGLELHEFIVKNIEDYKMQEIIDDYIENLTIGILNLISIFQPEAISIGGSFSYYEDIFLGKLKEKLKEKSEILNDNCPEIMLAVAKNDAGIIGASLG